MENPAVYVPYILMAINVVALSGILGYAVYCIFRKGCRTTVSGGNQAVK
jgi:mannitol-specific phosphotransferase system IIBC component